MMGKNQKTIIWKKFYISSFRKFSFEQPDLDDADEDGNTIYRGLAVPVDIRQVIEVKQKTIILKYLIIFNRYPMDII